MTAANQTVSYAFLVANTGNVTLTSVGVSDPLPGLGTITCPQTTLAPGASTTCTAAYTTTQANVDAGQILNTATATGTPPAGLTAPTATDTETVTATRTATIDLQKTSNPTSVGAANQVVNYSFLVTNTGNVTLSGIVVTDPLPNLSAVSCPSTTLAPSANMTCSATYTTTQSDIDAGSIPNLASVTSSPPAGVPGPVSDTDPNTVTVAQNASIAIDKTATPATVTAANETVNYSFLVTNNGNVTLTSVSVADPLPGLGAISCPATSLTPGADMTCTASYTVTQADIDGGTISNTALAQGLPPIGPAVNASDSATVSAVRTPSISILKSVAPSTVTVANEAIQYSFLVANDGNVTLDNVAVSDPLPGLGVVSCPGTTLGPATSMTCTANYAATQADIDAGQIVNTAGATGLPRGGGVAVFDSDSETVVSTRSASITIDKTVNPTVVSTANQPVVYSFLVTNTGNVTLTGIDVDDPLPGLGAISCPGTTLSPTASFTCSASYTTTQVDIDAGGFSNTATVAGTPPIGVSGPVTASDTANVVATRSAAIELTKSATPNNVTTAGQAITYSFHVTNMGNVNLSVISISDPLPYVGPISCPGTTLAPSADMICTASYTATQSDIDAGSIVNLATVTSTPPAGVTGPIVDTDAETVTTTRAPSIQVTKSASPSTVNAANQNVTYSFVVTNTGNVTLNGIVVSDPLAGLGPISCPGTSLVPSTGMTCTAGYTTTQTDINAGQIVNTASVTGTPPSGPQVGDTDTVTVLANRAPSITLAKSVTPTTIGAANQPVNYSFLVTNTGNVTLSGIAVADPLPGMTGMSCPTSTLQPGASTICTATKVVSQAEFDAVTLVNTASVSANAPGGVIVGDNSTATVTAVHDPSIALTKTANPTALSAANQTVAYTFQVVNTGNVTLSGIDISDALPGLSAISCPATTLLPSAVMTCTASKLVTQAEFDSGQVTNSATVVGEAPDATEVDDTDTAIVTTPAVPAISIDKSASPNNITAAGQTVIYSFVVRNEGNVTLSGINITDPMVGMTTPICPLTTLPPGVSTTCTASYVSDLDDVDLGRIDNTAIVSGNPPSGAAVTDADSETVTATAAPAIQIVKTANPTTVTAANQAVAYTFLVTNTGNVTLTGVAVTDPLPGLTPVSCPTTTLSPGTSTVCTAGYTTTQADIDLGSIDNTATVSGTPPTGPAVTDDDTESVTAPANPGIELTKQATPTTVSGAGDTISYGFLVRNTGNVTLTGVGVTDPMPGLSSVACPSTTLAPAATTTCTAAYAVTQADIDAGIVSNTALATGTPPSGPAVTDDDDENVTAPATPALSLDKTANPSTITTAGQTVTYGFLVTNTGNVTLTAIDVDDPLPNIGPITCPVSSLAPGSNTTCSASYVATQADVDAGRIDNAATATGLPPVGPAVGDGDTETVTAPSSPGIVLVKSAVPNNVTAAGDTVTYSFAVTNTGNVTLSSVAVTDPMPDLSPITCPSTSLAPSATIVCTATYVAKLADIDAGSINNTATTTGTPPIGTPVSDTDTETVTATTSPAIQVVKSASPTNVTAAGQVVTYSFRVINTGNVTLSAITVGDPLPDLGPITCPTTSLAPGLDMICTAAYTVAQGDVDAGSITNTASVTGTPPAGATVGDTDTAIVIATQTSDVSIVKSANPTVITAAGQPVAYSFLVTNTGNVTLSGIGVFDPLPGLGTVTCPSTTLAPGGSTTCTAGYTASQADIDLGSIDNTATVSGTPPTGPAITEQDSATVTAPSNPSISLAKSVVPSVITTAGQIVTYSFLVTNTGNVTLSGIAIADPLSGLGPISCPGTALAPSGSMTCTATKSATQGDIDAGAIDNTAIASGTPPAGGPVSDTDDATVTATANPSITIDKSATPNNVISAGQTVSYAFLVTNTGNVTLTGVVVDDPLTGPGSVGCPGSTLLPGESITCSATYNVTPGDMNNGVIDNTATVTGTPPSGPDVDDTDTESVTAVAAPAIQIVKTATPATITAAGQTVTYTFTVTNTGNVSLTAVVVSDPLPGLGPISCPGTTLTIGTSMTCSASYVTTQADVDAGSYSNTATATGTPPTGPSVSDTSSAVVIANRAPALTLDKSSSPSTVSSAGQTITYSFLVTNTGNVTLTSVTVGDPLPGLSAVSCPSMTLSPGASTTCTATKLATQGDIDAGVINNTATVTATPPGGGTVAAIDSHTVTAPPASSITLVKTASPTTIASVGQLINYSFVVTNTGNVTLTGVGVSDPKPGMSPVTCPTTTLAPSVSTTCTATYTTILADVNQGSIDNTATASGTPPSGPAVSDVDSETVTATQAPTITIDKSASPNNVSTVGQPVTYSFLITNTGNVTLTGVTVVDPIAGLSAISCPTTVLDPGTMTTCTATRAVTQSDLDSGSISNTATVTGTPPNGSDVTGTDTATVTVTAGPAIQLDKTATPTTVRTLSDTISYTFVVTNTGNVTLSAITVADPMLGGAVACPATTLAPTATMTCTASHGVTQADLDTGPILNTATVTGTPNVGPSVSDTDAATVLADPVDGMTLVKSATPSIIDAAGTSITYAFVVENTGDSTLDDVSISDPLVGLSAVACPSTTIAPGGQLTCTATYVATQADVDSGAVTNTATATATPGAGTPLTATDTVIVTATRTPSISLVKTATPETVGSAGAVVTFGFLATNTGNVTLTNVVVSDPMPGLSAVTCPGFAGLLAPGASTSCTATYTVTQADIDAGAIHNTATASGRAFFTGASGGTTVVSTGAVTVTLAQTPAIQIVKSVSAATVDDGTTVTYSFVVTNIGNMVLNDVRVEDPLPGLSSISCPGFDEELAPGESITCSATYRATAAAATDGRITNTANVSGRTAADTLISARSTVVLTVNGTNTGNITGGNTLPTSGTDVAPLIASAVGLLLAGGMLLLLGRRRRPLRGGET